MGWLSFFVFYVCVVFIEFLWIGLNLCVIGGVYSRVIILVVFVIVIVVF